MLDFPDVRIEVLVDSPLAPRIVALAESVGVTSYMLLTTLGGQGPQGRWRRDEVTGATAKQLFVTVLSPERAERLLSVLAPLLASYSLEVIAAPARRTDGTDPVATGI